MKQYRIDELRLEDHAKIKEHLDSQLGTPKMDGLYWVEINNALLSDVQQEHNDCKPFYFAVELNESFIACEFLIRTKNRIRCDCIANANQEQRECIMNFLDDVFEQLDIMC